MSQIKPPPKDTMADPAKSGADNIEAAKKAIAYIMRPDRQDGEASARQNEMVVQSFRKAGMEPLAKLIEDFSKSPKKDAEAANNFLKQLEQLNPALVQGARATADKAVAGVVTEQAVADGALMKEILTHPNTKPLEMQRLMGVAQREGVNPKTMSPAAQQYVQDQMAQKLTEVQGDILKAHRSGGMEAAQKAYVDAMEEAVSKAVKTLKANGMKPPEGEKRSEAAPAPTGREAAERIGRERIQAGVDKQFQQHEERMAGVTGALPAKGAERAGRMEARGEEQKAYNGLMRDVLTPATLNEHFKHAKEANGGFDPSPVQKAAIMAGIGREVAKHEEDIKATLREKGADAAKVKINEIAGEYVMLKTVEMRDNPQGPAQKVTAPAVDPAAARATAQSVADLIGNMKPAGIKP